MYRDKVDVCGEGRGEGDFVEDEEEIEDAGGDTAA